MSHNVSFQRLDELPILGIGGTLSGSAGIRNPYAMVQLIPGSHVDPQQSGPPQWHSCQYAIVPDRGSGRIQLAALPAYRRRVQPSVDAIQEVAIQTSNYAAEYGQVGGGVFNVTMKSGTNQISWNRLRLFCERGFQCRKSVHQLNRRQSAATGPAKRLWLYSRRCGPASRYKAATRRSSSSVSSSSARTRYVNNQFQTVPTSHIAMVISASDAAERQRSIGIDPLGRQMFEGMIYDPATTRTAPDGRLFRDPFPNNIIPQDRFDPVAVKIQALFRSRMGPSRTTSRRTTYRSIRRRRVTQVPSFKIDQMIGQTES